MFCNICFEAHMQRSRQRASLLPGRIFEIQISGQSQSFLCINTRNVSQNGDVSDLSLELPLADTQLI